MPCIKCSNGKWKYGERGRCQFDTLSACNAAAAAIHARDKKELESQTVEKGCDCDTEWKQHITPKTYIGDI